MKRLTAALTIFVCILLWPVEAGAASFGLKSADMTFTGPDGSSALVAGSHPFAITTNLEVNTVVDPKLGEVPVEGIKDLRIQLPAGLVGAPTAVPQCSEAHFLQMAFFAPESNEAPPCGNETAIGITTLKVGVNEPLEPGTTAVYNLTPQPGDVLQLGFIAAGFPITLPVRLQDKPPYNAVLEVKDVPQAVSLYSAKTVIWGNPGVSAHDSERGVCAWTKGEDSCPVSPPQQAFLTMPRRCGGPLETVFEADSWQHPGTWIEPISVASHDDSVPPRPQGVVGCGDLGFGPQIQTRLSTSQAESPSGLSLGLNVEDSGLVNPSGRAQSDIEATRVEFPEGVTVNPSAANGLLACTATQLADEDLQALPGGGCPLGSKLGQVEIETPLLQGVVLEGSLFVAQPDDPSTPEPGAENPFDALLATYLVIKEPALGILIKLPGEVSTDQATGRLTATFGRPPFELPQFPFSHFRLRLREGPLAPLVTPSHCGSYSVFGSFTPGAFPANVMTKTASFDVEAGIGGGSCLFAVEPFGPTLAAGTTNNNAASFSPFSLRLRRQDGEAEITRLSASLPPGVIGKLAGVSMCPDSALAAAKGRPGRRELESPSCPAGSEIGHLLAGAGVGPSLTYVPGRLYLAGPYAGAPLSVAAITPGVAGPFDLGTVVVREALRLNPDDATVEVDGAASEAIPRILQGIPLKLRDLRLYVDRPDFVLNATNCEASAVDVAASGATPGAFTSGDSAKAELSNRYQAANCAALKFRPQLSLRLNGGVKRADHPSLRAVVKAQAGDANIGRAVVTLPHSAFLEQGHIRTICTRVQFAADKCPAGSVYGHARAFTPLLDEPLEGPVYLRSSSHPLPDLVVALHGLVDVNLVGRIDTVNARIRTTFESVPDAPVSKFVLTMQGGKKGLIVNSQNLCQRKHQARVQLSGQNGALKSTSPVVAVRCHGKRPKAGSKK